MSYPLPRRLTAIALAIVSCASITTVAAACDDSAALEATHRVARGAAIPGQLASDSLPIPRIARGGSGGVKAAVTDVSAPGSSSIDVARRARGG